MDIKDHNGWSNLYTSLARLYQYFNFKSKMLETQIYFAKNKIKLKKTRTNQKLIYKISQNCSCFNPIACKLGIFFYPAATMKYNVDP